MFKKIFHLSNILCTVYILLFIYLISNINIQSSLLDPLDSALKDFEITDIVYSQFRHTTHQEDADFVIGESSADTNIVIVNIGELSRAELAVELMNVGKYKPKVIGIDAFFRKPKEDVEGDSMLSRALQLTPNVVLVSKLHYNEQTDNFDSLELSHPMFSHYSDQAFANLITGEDKASKTARTFNPISICNNKKEISFPVKLASYLNKPQADKFLSRNNDVEIINFRGNLNKYHVLDIDDLYNDSIDKSFIKGKIVLMGFIGRSMHESSWEDMFYSPLNKNYAGKAYPDIYGIVVHANIISMVLNNDAIDVMPSWLGYLIGIILCHLNVVIFHYILKNHGMWYGALTKFLQLLQSVVLILVILYIYDIHSYKIESSLSFAAIVLGGDLIEIWFDGILHIKLSKLAMKQYIRLKNINFNKKLTP